MSSGIGLTGVFSTIDTDILIQRLIEVESGPITRLANRKTTYEARQVAIDDIQRRLEQFSDITSQMRGTSALRAVNAGSSDTDVLTASAAAGAIEGVHTVIVDQLARSATLVHTDGLASAGSLVGEGQFVYSYSGVTRTVNTVSSTTLDDLQGLINNDASNPGVTASVLEYGGAYRLVLTGRQTGDDYAVTIEDETTLSGFEAADFTETQTAQSARIRVDGFPADGWIERNSNSISDVLIGVTLDLKTVGTATVNLTRSTSQLKQDLNSFVAIFNGLVQVVETYTGYEQDTEQGGVLQGDRMISGIVDRLRGPMIGRATGFVEGTDAYFMAAQIGLELDDGGLLALDETALDEALAADYDAVLNLIGALGSGASDSTYIQFMSAHESTEAGTYEVEVDFDGGGDIQVARIRNQGESAWRFMTIDDGTIIGEAGNPEQGLELTVAWDGASSTQSAEVRVREGLAPVTYDLVDVVLDEDSGVIAAMEEECQSAITELDKLIEIQQERLEKKTAALQRKFARMEQALAQLESLRGAVDSLVAAMSQSSTNNKN